MEPERGEAPTIRTYKAIRKINRERFIGIAILAIIVLVWLGIAIGYAL